MTRNIFFQHIKYRKEKKEAAKIWLSLRQSSTKKNTEKYIAALSLFTFPSRYCSSIGHQVVFRLGWWSTRFPTGFLVSRGTLDTRCQSHLSNTGLSPSVAGLPMPFF